ncbi:hypothetical protein ACJMK2_020357 [Sinanodonta woodiana]|uniref:Kinesin motor domain-containing protein n=1 Tax=Sinanodonta woodiana TaxID=1069815 RepID=A0ABD3TYT8_SINWO
MESQAESKEVNVRVAVRIRPLLPKEKLNGEEVCVRVVPNSNQLVMGKDRAFTFDNVLSSKTTQEEVFQLCVEPLVKSCFEGYNATVFAYGQTGSGKTYTIGGGNISSLTEEEYGVIPRAIKQMFDIINAEQNISFCVKVSYVEIYKEELQDLLDVDKSSKEIHVREDDKGNTVIIGAREVECSTLDEMMSLLEAGSAVRHTGSTQMNEHSSRSHSVFTVVISQTWTEGDVLATKRKQSQSESIDGLDEEITHNTCAKFHFVDLAGSERAHKTGNVGDRFKESVHINSGLLSLGNVISALGDPKKKSTHIPYRESKITRILKDSLGGNAKTVMICCISPSTASFDESLNALKYANRARNIKNLPIINRDIQSIRFEEMQSEIKALREELARQRTSILSAGGTEIDLEKAHKDASQIKKLEEKVIRLQTECGHYRVIAEEAYKQLIQIQGKDFLSRSQDIRLKDWLDLMEEIKNKVPSTLSRDQWESQTIKDLQSELRKAREDLKNDEEIFADKTKEVKELKARNVELESMLQHLEKCVMEAEEQKTKQEQQYLEQHVKIEELQKALKVTLIGESHVLDDLAVTASAPPTTRQRPKSVPVHLNRQSDANYSHLRPPSRNIKTSPALFTLDRVMKSFRARSQLLVSRLEDGDEVLRVEFSDEGSIESNEVEGVEEEEGAEEKEEGKFERKGTFRVKKGPKKDSKDTIENKENNLPEIRISRETIRGSRSIQGNADLNVPEIPANSDVQKKIKKAQLKILESNTKIRDLAINIRLKEQLIRELVKTGKDAEQMNKQYAEKLAAMEKEREQVKQELGETQKILSDLEAREQQETSEKQKLQLDYRKKIELGRARMAALQRKQKETEKMASLTTPNNKKIQDLELAVDRMKQQQENLQKKLKEETETKSKLEREMQKEQQRVKELEIKNEQQQKILRRKNEEIASAKRRLRSGTTLPPINGEEHDSKIEEQRRWLDSEVEKIVEQRRQIEELQQELQKREEIIARKEAILSQKSELEIKKLRSSQVLNKNLLSVSAKLETVDQMLEEKKRELAHTPDVQKPVVQEEIQKLKHSREKLQKQRGQLDEKLHEGSLLSDEEERRLIELDEAIDALDAAIEYKTDIIRSRQLEVRHSHTLSQSEDNLLNRLNALTSQETKSLLAKYFEKVVSLRENERKTSLKFSTMEVKIDEQERLIQELEASLQRSVVEMDRRLTTQQKEYEQKIQLLMHQLMENNSRMSGGDNLINDGRIEKLQKDLYYYKVTSRELKKKLRELIANGTISAQDFDLRNSVQSSMADNDGGSQSHRETQPVRTKESRISAEHPADHGTRPVSTKVGQLQLNTTPVKISRRDLRLMSEAEISMRRSSLKESVGSSTAPKDSLDPGENPWK